MNKRMVKALAALLLSGSTLAVAAPFSVTWTDTIDGPSSDPAYIGGQAVSVTFVLDNGGASTISQTWNAVDVVSVTYVINNGAITTVFDPNSGDGLSSTSGSFVTDGTGALTAVPTSWNDSSGTVPVISSNDPLGSSSMRWWVNGSNEVYNNDSGATDAALYANNVDNNIEVAFWSDPVPEGSPSPSTAVPTMSIYVLVLTTLGLLLVATRRLRPSFKRS